MVDTKASDMRFLCPQCSCLVSCADSDCGGSAQCPDCLHSVAVPAGRCEPGAVIGDFVVRERIAAGGMGTVYRADQLSLLRPAALKILHASLSASPSQLNRFLKEARIAASVNHPNLIGVFAVGEEDGLHYLAMEYIRGKSVQDVLTAQGRLPLEQAADIAVQVAAGLDAAWKKRSIVHCDVKPGNILLPDEGGVKIADLGLAEIGGTSPVQGEDDDTFGGSPYYVCPEVILGKTLDHRSDLYSLGITLFEMLTGHLPFEGTELSEIAGRHLYAPPPDPRRFAPELPPGVADIVTRLLSKAPEDRFQSAAELIQALRVQVLLRTSPELAGETPQVKGTSKPSRWPCPACARSNVETARYCVGCGAYGRFPCPLCGEEVVLNAQFCSHCGGNLAEQRQGIVRQAESLLSRMDEVLSKGDMNSVGRLVGEFRALDQSVLPELVRGQFNDVVSHLSTLSEIKVQEAREGLRLDLLEQAAGALVSVAGVEQYQWLKDQVDALKNDMAQTVFQAGSALKSNCPATCQRFLTQSVVWQGGSLGARFQELKQQCDASLALRDHAALEAQAVIDSAQPDLRDAVQAQRNLARCRMSPKIMVLAPDEADTQADGRLVALAERLEKILREGLAQWLEQEAWAPVADLLEMVRACEDDSLAGVERFISSSVSQEIQDRYRAALDAERAKDVRRAMRRWNEVLSVPPRLLPRQIRREALAFPARRSRMITEQRRPLLRASLSAVFFLWCLSFCLATIDVVVLWFNEEPVVSTVRSHAVPIAVQLVIIALFARLLRNPRALSEDDPVPGRQPPVFVSGLMMLWILSPLNGVLVSLCHRAGTLALSGELPTMLEPLAAPWVALTLATLFWLIGDFRIAGRYRSPLVRCGMTLSWFIALGVVYLLWSLPLDTPLLQVAVAMYQAIAFALLQFANYLWLKSRSDKTEVHPELLPSVP